MEDVFPVFPAGRPRARRFSALFTLTFVSALAGCTADVARSSDPGAQGATATGGTTSVAGAGGTGAGAGGLSGSPATGGSSANAGTTSSTGGSSPSTGGTSSAGAGAKCVSTASPGAPVPMRRLTATQVERSVADILGVSLTLNVEDEKLGTFRSNVSTSVDTASARGYLDFAEATVSATDLSRCETDCLPWLLDEVALRLFRRPLNDDERIRYQALFDLGVENTNPETAAGWVLETLLQSPSFLYVDEVVKVDGTLDDFSVAARLSLLLWGRNPDQTALARAEQGELSTPLQIEEEVSRLLADPASEGGIREFVDQWLDLARLDEPDVRPDIAELGTEVIAALRDEPVRFFHRLLREGASVGELLTDSRTVASSVLVDLYADDILSSTAEDFALDPTRRKGILALPGVAAALSHARRTSPTLRGKAILTGLLCTPPEPPPADVDTTLPEVADDVGTRERLEQHMSAPACQGCHFGMDNLGFTLEKIDWLGRFREAENGLPIDDEGTFPLGSADVTVTGAPELADALAATPDVSACIARQWLRYSGGVTESAEADCLVQSLGETLAGSAGLERMIVQTVTSDWFRRGPGEAP